MSVKAREIGIAGLVAISLMFSGCGNQSVAEAISTEATEYIEETEVLSDVAESETETEAEPATIDSVSNAHEYARLEQLLQQLKRATD